MSDYRGRGWSAMGDGMGAAVLLLTAAVSWVLVANTYVIGSAIARWIGGGP